jgi:hypothetical protein
VWAKPQDGSLGSTPGGSVGNFRKLFCGPQGSICGLHSSKALWADLEEDFGGLAPQQLLVRCAERQS